MTTDHDDSVDSRARELRDGDSAVALARRELKKQASVLGFPDLHQERLTPGRIHRMRVATRRARSVLRAFKDVLPQSLDASFGDDLKWLTATLGQVRDLDVYREHLAAYRDELPKDDAEALYRYGKYLDAEWEKACAELTQALSSPRYLKFMTQFNDALDDASLVASAEARMTIHAAGERYIEAAKSRVLKRGRRIHRGSATAKLHQLRKDAKRLRYVLEFFEPFFGRRLHRALKAAVRLQDVLGTYQDGVAANERLRAYADAVSLESGSRRELLALGRLMEIESRRCGRARKRFAKNWRQFDAVLDGMRLVD